MIEHAEKIASIASDAVTVIAAVVALLWFHQTRRTVMKLKMQLSASHVKQSDGSFILIVHAMLENIGELPIPLQRTTCEIKELKPKSVQTDPDAIDRNRRPFGAPVVPCIETVDVIYPKETNQYRFEDVIPADTTHVLIRVFVPNLKAKQKQEGPPQHNQGWASEMIYVL